MMINNSFKALISTFICFVITYISFFNLSSYILTNRNNFSFVITKALEIIDASTMVKIQIFASVLTAIAGIALCVMIINYLYPELRVESLSHIRKLSLIMWIVLLIVDILILLYSLAFLIGIIFFGVIILFTAAISGGNGRGGPVHVRGHYRKGSYVRSHTRRTPHHF